MNHASIGSSDVSLRAKLPAAGARWINGAAVVLSTLLAVSVIVVGLRVTLDADALASRFSAEGSPVYGSAVRCFGVALLSAGQAIAIAGVVWRLHRRRRIDRWLVLAGVLTGFLAAFAGGVLVVAG